MAQNAQTTEGDKPTGGQLTTPSITPENKVTSLFREGQVFKDEAAVKNISTGLKIVLGLSNMRGMVVAKADKDGRVWGFMLPHEQSERADELKTLLESLGTVKIIDIPVPLNTESFADHASHVTTQVAEVTLRSSKSKLFESLETFVDEHATAQERTQIHSRIKDIDHYR